MNLVETNNGNYIYQSKNVQIRDIDTLPPQTVEKIREAAGVIDNYAGHHKSKITFYDARKDMGESDFYTVDKMLTESMGISVQKKGENVSHATWVNRYGNEVDGKPFLRTIYEKIQWLVEGKESRIVEHKAETMRNLIKAGKVIA